MVPVTGLEPVRCHQQGILSPQCLPFHHTGEHRHKLSYHTGVGLSIAILFFLPCHFSLTPAYNGKTHGGGETMGKIGKDEDLDDLIFGEEEWSASQR